MRAGEASNGREGPPGWKRQRPAVRIRRPREVPVKHWVPFPISPIPGATLAVAGPLPHVPGD